MRKFSSIALNCAIYWGSLYTATITHVHMENRPLLSSTNIYTSPYESSFLVRCGTGRIWFDMKYTIQSTESRMVSIETFCDESQKLLFAIALKTMPHDGSWYILNEKSGYLLDPTYTGCPILRNILMPEFPFGKSANLVKDYYVLYPKLVCAYTILKLLKEIRENESDKNAEEFKVVTHAINALKVPLRLIEAIDPCFSSFSDEQVLSIYTFLENEISLNTVQSLFHSGQLLKKI